MAGGFALTVVSLVAFTLAGPTTIVGQETDVTIQDPGSQPPASVPNGSSDTGPDAAPPASLPSAGDGGYAATLGSASVIAMALLAVLGMGLVGAGTLISRSVSGRRDI
jgi:hypothetical protein